MRAFARVVLLGASLLGARAAAAQDIGEAVEWLDEAGAGEQAAGLEHLADDASDHSALPMINSRDVVRGRPLDAYVCDEAPIDSVAVLRTSGQQGWALRQCRERLFQQDAVAGYVTMGPRRLHPREVAPWAEAAGAATDVPPTLIDTIVRFVSGYRPGLVSEAGHVGLMQLRPSVLAALGIPHGDLTDPQENLRVGALYLRSLVFRFGALRPALVAFRDGPEVLEANGGKVPNDKRYLWFAREVMRIYTASVREFPEHLGAENMAFVFGWLE